jgi:hypothetical protein
MHVCKPTNYSFLSTRYNLPIKKSSCTFKQTLDTSKQTIYK